jgi:hypothetical protein
MATVIGLLVEHDAGTVCGRYDHLTFRRRTINTGNPRKATCRKLTDSRRINGMRRIPRYTKETCWVTPGITEPRCHVCMSPHRALIEFYTLKGRAKRWIARRVPPDERGRRIDYRSISKHYERHMFIRSPFLRN